MRFVRLGELGQEQPAVIVDGRHYDVSPVHADIDPSFFAADGVARVAAALEQGTLAELDVAPGTRLGAAVARPAAVVCIGMNYAAHAAESGNLPPDQPVLFYKHPNTVVGPNDDVRIPRGAQKTDWEVELGIVIGKRVRYLDSPEQAPDHIAGYVLSNDVSERAFQQEVSGGQWSKGKACETFNPLGPEFVTSDEVGDPQKLQLRSWVNGEIRQDSSTADMVFDVNTIVHHLSQFMVLEPGDIVNTGTPEGVALSGRFPYLVAGDVMELEITGLGRQRQQLVSWDAE
jgi:2,4-diketo-3-deoxy-L-fuconate hydrolase